MVQEIVTQRRSGSLPFARAFTAPAATEAEQRRFYLALGALGIALWVVRALLTKTPVFPLDDAYITLHSAQALFAGGDRNYPGTPPLCGATCAPHLALVAALLSFLPPLWALDTAMGVGLLLYPLGLARLAFAHQASRLQATLVVIAGLTAALTPHQLFNGLETGLAMAGLVWTLALAADPRTSRHPLVPALCGVLPYLRPELAVISFLLLALRAWDHWRGRRSPAEAIRATGTDLLLAAAGALPWAVWYAASIGTPFPTTMAAKRAFFAEAGLPPGLKLDWVKIQLMHFGSLLGLLAAAVLLLVRTRIGWVGLAFAATMLAAYYSAFPGALGHNEQRYLYLFVPILLYGAAACLEVRRPRLRALGTLFLAIVAVQSASSLLPRWADHLNRCDAMNYELRGVALWCRRHLPAHSTLLIHDAGYLAFATRFHMVDFVGLKTPASVAYHQRETAPSLGAERGAAVGDIALRSHPDYLVMLHPWDLLFHVTPGMRQQGWQLEKLRESMRGYEVYRLRPPARTARRPRISSPAGTKHLPGSPALPAEQDQVRRLQ